jgi:hypothetical protein
MQNTFKADFSNHGSIFVHELRTETAAAWVEERLPKDALTFGEVRRSQAEVHRRHRSRAVRDGARGRMNDELSPTRSTADSRRATWVTSGHVELESKA